MNNRQNMELVLQHKIPEFIPHFRTDTYKISDYFVERPITTTGRDAWGCNWISCESSLGITHPDTSDIKFEDIEDWREKTQFPDLDNMDFAPVYADSKAVTDRDSQMVAYTSLNGIFERTHVLMGFENALCQTLLNPEEFGEFLKAIADHKIKLFKKVYEIAQPDILVFHDDMATQSAPYFPNSFYKEYIFPQYKRIVDACREVGYKYIIQHSCGKIETLIPDWLSCGFDGWHSVMPCNNLVEIKKNYGDKLVFFPGLDIQAVLGNPKATRSEIEKMLINWYEMLASDGTGLVNTAGPSLSLSPQNEAICMEFHNKHKKLFVDAKRAGIEYIPDFE